MAPRKSNRCKKGKKGAPTPSPPHAPPPNATAPPSWEEFNRCLTFRKKWQLLGKTTRQPSDAAELVLCSLDFPPMPLSLFNGDKRAWNAKWESELRRAYSQQDYTDNISFMVESLKSGDGLFVADSHLQDHRKGQGLLMKQGDAIRKIVEGDSFTELATTWHKMGVRKREEYVLEALASTSQELDTQVDFEPNRVFAPELTLEAIAGDNGDGLLQLAKALYTEGVWEDGKHYLMLRNAQLEKAVAMNFSETAMPASLRLRGFHNEIRLIRQSYLQGFVSDILFYLRCGSNLTPAGFASSLPLESESYSILSQPTECDGCGKTLEELGIDKFLVCSACKKVGRDVPYCSRECQVKNYTYFRAHRGTCGKPLSVPVFGSSSSSTKPVTYELVQQLNQLRNISEESHAVWFYWVNDNECRGLGVTSEPPYAKPRVPTPKTDRMREIRDHAVRERDDESIGILAGWLLAVVDWKWEGERGIIESKVWVDIDVKVLKTDLMKSFDLDEQELDRMIEKGWNALEEEGREIERELWRTEVDNRPRDFIRVAQRKGNLERGNYAEAWGLLDGVDEMAPSTSRREEAEDQAALANYDESTATTGEEINPDDNLDIALRALSAFSINKMIYGLPDYSDEEIDAMEPERREDYLEKLKKIAEASGMLESSRTSVDVND